MKRTIRTSPHFISQPCGLSLIILIFRLFFSIKLIDNLNIRGWISVSRLLLDYNADINAATIVGRTALMYAVEFLNGHLVCAIIIIIIIIILETSAS